MKTRKTNQSALISKDFQFDIKREKEYLLMRYKNKEAIFTQLREIPAHSHTYQFLGELFFQIAVNEFENDPPTDEWVNQLKEVRNDIYVLFELARAARFV